jgi:ribosomal-protein-alanine N-acetyltransferase
MQRLLSKIRCLFDRKYSSHQRMVTQPSQAILGYASMWLMIDEAHLTSIAVRETHRRQGIGELLLIFVIELSIQVNAEVVTLEVRSSNLAAQALYRKYGFAEVGIRRNYYSEDGEDAVIMTTETINTASYRAKLQGLKREYVERWGTIWGCLA